MLMLFFHTVLLVLNRLHYKKKEVGKRVLLKTKQAQALKSCTQSRPKTDEEQFIPIPCCCWDHPKQPNNPKARLIVMGRTVQADLLSKYPFICVTHLSERQRNERKRGRAIWWTKKGQRFRGGHKSYRSPPHPLVSLQ